jgi:hypothetical protein
VSVGIAAAMRVAIGSSALIGGKTGKRRDMRRRHARRVVAMKACLPKTAAEKNSFSSNSGFR